jgi:hypothetical protein
MHRLITVEAVEENPVGASEIFDRRHRERVYNTRQSVLPQLRGKMLSGTISRPKLEGREAEIFAERDGKLEAPRRQRQRRCQEVFVPVSDQSGDSSTAALN